MCDLDVGDDGRGLGALDKNAVARIRAENRAPVNNTAELRGTRAKPSSAVRQKIVRTPRPAIIATRPHKADKDRRLNVMQTQDMQLRSGCVHVACILLFKTRV